MTWEAAIWPDDCFGPGGVYGGVLGHRHNGGASLTLNPDGIVYTSTQIANGVPVSVPYSIRFPFKPRYRLRLAAVIEEQWWASSSPSCTQ